MFTNKVCTDFVSIPGVNITAEILTSRLRFLCCWFIFQVIDFFLNMNVVRTGLVYNTMATRAESVLVNRSFLTVHFTLSL